MPTPFTDDDLNELVANYPDLFKSFGIGVAQGATDVAGVPGDLRSLAGRAATAIGIPDNVQSGIRSVLQGSKFTRGLAGPTSQQIREHAEGITGPFYEPQTRLGGTAANIGRVGTHMIAGAPIMNALKAGTERNIDNIRALWAAR